MSNPLYENLSYKERVSLQNLNSRLSGWIMHISSFKKLDRSLLDRSKNLTDDEYFELNDLQWKIWGRKE